MKMKLLVVVVNYRTPHLALECLRSLAWVVNDGVDVRAVIVDNCSGDNSACVIRNEVEEFDFKFPVTFMQSERNGGFAYGNNQVLRKFLTPSESADCYFGADNDVIWLLNPDTYLQERGVCSLLDFMRLNPKVGIVGSKVVNQDGTVRRSAFRTPSFFSEVDSALAMGPVSKLLRRFQVAPKPSVTAMQVDWVSGASLFLRLGAMRSVGLMDEKYFMYFEETDYCLSVKKQGFEVWLWPDFSVVHLVGQASGVTGASRMLKRRPKYWFESRAYFFRKNFGSAYLHCANLAWLLCYPIGRVWQRLRGKACEDPPYLWWDFFRYYYLMSAAA